MTGMEHATVALGSVYVVCAVDLAGGILTSRDTVIPEWVLVPLIVGTLVGLSLVKVHAGDYGLAVVYATTAGVVLKLYNDRQPKKPKRVKSRDGEWL